MFCPGCGADGQTANAYCKRCGDWLPEFKRRSSAFGGEEPQQNIFTGLFLSALSAIVALFSAMHFTLLTLAPTKRSGPAISADRLKRFWESERSPWHGRVSDRPFVLACQPSLFDTTRAPEGNHTLWAYCQVPHGSDTDVSDRIEDQIERFAPGFRKLVLARHIMSPAQLEAHNSNLIGGDINGGAQIVRQMFSRPTLKTYSTAINDVYICSSSTPPGGGVHGMCGYHAARVALRKSFP